MLGNATSKVIRSYGKGFGTERRTRTAGQNHEGKRVVSGAGDALVEHAGSVQGSGRLGARLADRLKVKGVERTPRSSKPLKCASLENFFDTQQKWADGTDKGGFSLLGKKFSIHNLCRGISKVGRDNTSWNASSKVIAVQSAKGELSVDNTIAGMLSEAGVNAVGNWRKQAKAAAFVLSALLTVVGEAGIAVITFSDFATSREGTLTMICKVFSGMIQEIIPAVICGQVLVQSNQWIAHAVLSEDDGWSENYTELFENGDIAGIGWSIKGEIEQPALNMKDVSWKRLVMVWMASLAAGVRGSTCAGSNMGLKVCAVCENSENLRGGCKCDFYSNGSMVNSIAGVCFDGADGIYCKCGTAPTVEDTYDRCPEGGCRKSNAPTPAGVPAGGGGTAIPPAPIAPSPPSSDASKPALSPSTGSTGGSLSPNPSGNKGDVSGGFGTAAVVAVVIGLLLVVISALLVYKKWKHRAHARSHGAHMDNQSSVDMGHANSGRVILSTDASGEAELSHRQHEYELVNIHAVPQT